MENTASELTAKHAHQSSQDLDLEPRQIASGSPALFDKWPDFLRERFPAAEVGVEEKRYENPYPTLIWLEGIHEVVGTTLASRVRVLKVTAPNGQVSSYVFVEAEISARARMISGKMSLNYALFDSANRIFSSADITVDSLRCGENLGYQSHVEFNGDPSVYDRTQYLRGGSLTFQNAHGLLC